MAWKPKVGRHVTYYLASGKPRSATITNVDSATQLDLRIGHAGGASVVANSVERATVAVPMARATKWRATA